MRIFAVSDVHVDYDVNARWVEGLSLADYQDDVLILAGDISDSIPLLSRCLSHMVRRFRQVLFVPGNHDLWVVRDQSAPDSFAKFDLVMHTARECGASTHPFHHGSLSIVPLMSWYDYSFAQPTAELRRNWMDYRACKWPGLETNPEVTTRFLGMNHHVRRSIDDTIISFSHFLPRVDVMPVGLPDAVRALFPVMGSARLDVQVRQLGSAIHVYGHSHLNRRLLLDGTLYVNNAFAYPRETRIAAKALACIHEVP
ncbi:MAG: hypothetical protein RLZZ618_1524 [Pseudomonadota bacterium]|jgi:predicted phosphodiesterase